MGYRYSFEKLKVWSDARELVKTIYKTTENFPDKEKFGLSSQIQIDKIANKLNALNRSFLQRLNQLNALIVQQ